MITTKTASSTGEVTMNCLRYVIFLEIGILEGKRYGLIVDDIKGHSKPVLKDYVTSFLSGNDRTPEQEGYKICEWLIMVGGITCKSQSIDMLFGKRFKGNYRKCYDIYMLTALVNAKKVANSSITLAICSLDYQRIKQNT